MTEEAKNPGDNGATKTGSRGRSRDGVRDAKLAEILAISPPPTDEEMEEAKLRLAGKMERFEYIAEGRGLFLDALNVNNRKLMRTINTTRSSDALRKCFQTSKEPIKRALSHVMEKQITGESLKKRAEIIDRFCHAQGGPDFKPDGPPQKRDFASLPKPKIPTYEEFLGERDQFWGKSTLLCSSTMRPYTIPSQFIPKKKRLLPVIKTK